MPRAASSRIQGAKGLEHGTSPKGGLVHADGEKPGPRAAFSSRTASCSRVTGASGQYSGGSVEHPALTPVRTSAAIHGAAKQRGDTSTKPLHGTGTGGVA